MYRRPSLPCGNQAGGPYEGNPYWWSWGQCPPHGPKAEVWRQFDQVGAVLDSQQALRLAECPYLDPVTNKREKN